jgi:NodT family efflux transporter outer membrane factor (OMF) lipoprotein
MKRIAGFRFLFFAAAASLWAGGCFLHQPNTNPRPGVDSPVAYTFPVSPRLRDLPWWSVFDDLQLGALIEQAFAENYSLHQAVVRIEQARARAKFDRAEIGPELDIFGSALGGWQENSQRRRNLELGFDLTWEADLWGRLSSAANAAAYEAGATVFDYDALKLLLSGEVADTYFRVLEQIQTLDLLDEQVGASRQNLDFISVTFGQGGAPAIDVLQQKEQLSSVYTQRPRPEANLRIFRNRLAVLMGQVPAGQAVEESTAFPALDLNQPLGVPSELLMERPDLRAIAARMVALDYRIAEAIADCYPRLTLGGDVGRSSTVDPSVFFANALAEAVGPILDSGRRQAVIELRRAEFEERLALFSEAFLVALEEVENALWEERHQRELIQSLEEQRAIANDLLTESKAQYAQGASSDYLSVLTALQSLQRIDRELIGRRRELLSIRIRLYLATGGPMPQSSPG